MFNLLSEKWSERAVVHHTRYPASHISLDEEKLDFKEELLPFSHHENWKILDYEIRSKVLSYGWILYNRKTIFIETDIVSPACEILLKKNITNVDNFSLQKSVAEALLDEAMHTKMSVDACHAICAFRGLKTINFQDFTLVKERKKMLSQVNSAWERNIITLGIACASETLITDYLQALSSDDSIQPMCKCVTQAHAQDELLHASLFSQIMHDFVLGLNAIGKQLVLDSISKAEQLFGDPELDIWHDVLIQCGVKKATEIIQDIRHQKDVSYVYRNAKDSFIERCGLDDYIN